MAFAPKPGCPMCGIVSAAAATATGLPSSPPASNVPEILWRDDNFTVYRETVHPVSSKGHIVVVFNLHVPSIYTLSSSDLPLLVSLRDLSYRLLVSLQNAPSPLSSPVAAHPQNLLGSLHDLRQAFRVGFITPPFRDSKVPVTDHLHAHAYVLPADRLGWWRGVAYSSIAWYDINDLIAEIRYCAPPSPIPSILSLTASPHLRIKHVPYIQRGNVQQSRPLRRQSSPHRLRARRRCATWHSRRHRDHRPKPPCRRSRTRRGQSPTSHPRLLASTADVVRTFPGRFYTPFASLTAIWSSVP
ncbi:hypothetical protein BD414DRAFT_479352 [Trametes punicea]|nr:hypothetical protein BD414DRAFT_479352 [Trametes punicea]